jgi:NAD(P)-dependent dehydrogenase (short-subunit alcohol dehydrogenase family)
MAERSHWLAGRVAVVTGASRGIGAASAEAMAAVGACVVLAARDGGALNDLVERITASGERPYPCRPTSAMLRRSSGSSQ